MRKILLLLTLASTAAFTGCTINDDEPDVIENNYTFVADAYEIDPATLAFEPSTGRYEYLVDFGQQLYPADVVLVYRWVNDNGFGAWQQIPRTLYLGNNEEVDYDFNFTRNDLLIYADANFDLALAPEFTVNQAFRVVIVPANFTSGRVDYSNYEAVANMLNIKEENIKKLN